MNPYGDSGTHQDADAPHGARNWIAEIWTHIIGEALGTSPTPRSFLETPALSRISVSSPHVLRPFRNAQRTLPVSARIRPGNFLLSASIARLGEPAGTNRARLHLVRAYTTDARRWLSEPWTDLYSGQGYHVTTSDPAPPAVARIRSYRDVIVEFCSNPEPKSADADGRTASRRTRGLLVRRRIRRIAIERVGKETNRLEDMQNGMIHQWREVTNVYVPPLGDRWDTVVVPRLKELSATAIATAVGISTRAVRSIRNGHSLPSGETRRLSMIV